MATHVQLPCPTRVPPRKLVAAFGILVLATAICPSSQASKRPRLRITTPADGAIVASHELVVIEASFDPPIQMRSTPVHATITAVGQGNHFRVASGDTRDLSDLNQIQGLWDIAAVPAGQYEISVTVQAGKVHAQASVSVTVHKSPTAEIKLQSIHKTEAGFEVTLRAEVSSPNQTPVAIFSWSPGDGSPEQRTEAPTFSHVYQPGANYQVWLEAIDTKGGVALVARRLSLINVPSYQQHTTDQGRQPFGTVEIGNNKCGCKSMILKTSGKTRYCISNKFKTPSGCKDLTDPPPDAVGPNPKKQCTDQQLLVECSLDQQTPVPGTFRAARRFEIVSELTTDTTDPSLCKEGQYDKGTTTIDGSDEENPDTKDAPSGGGEITLPGSTKKITVVKNGAKYPKASDSEWGADDYTKQRTLKVHEPSVIRWSDSPGVTDPAETMKDVSELSELIAFIEGNPDTTESCWCQFKVSEKWKKGTNGAADTKSSEVELIDSKNCTKQ